MCPCVYVRVCLGILVLFWENFILRLRDDDVRYIGLFMWLRSHPLSACREGRWLNRVWGVFDTNLFMWVCVLCVWESNTAHHTKPNLRNRPNQNLLVPDWLITSHVTQITSSDWLFTWFGRLLQNLNHILLFFWIESSPNFRFYRDAEEHILIYSTPPLPPHIITFPLQLPFCCIFPWAVFIHPPFMCESAFISQPIIYVFCLPPTRHVTGPRNTGPWLADN